MPESYLEISGADRMELEVVAEELMLEDLKRVLKAAVIDAAEEDGKLSEKRALSVAEGALARVRWEFPVKEFIDSIGRLGWEVLPRSKTREVRRRLHVYDCLKQSRLPQALNAVKMRGTHRVKKLRGG